MQVLVTWSVPSDKLTTHLNFILSNFIFAQYRPPASHALHITSRWTSCVDCANTLTLWPAVNDCITQLHVLQSNWAVGAQFKPKRGVLSLAFHGLRGVLICSARAYWFHSPGAETIQFSTAKHGSA